MSLVAFALRACAVRIVRAAVASSFIVLDSPVDAYSALQDTRQSDGSFQGIIAVYTGAGENRVEGVGVFAGGPVCELFLQILLPSQVTLSNASGATLALNSRNSGAEFALDLTERAIFRGIAVQGDVWSQLFARLISDLRKVEWQSYLVETANVRTPGRSIAAHASVLEEPTPGAQASPFWDDFIAAMATDADLAPLAGWVTAELQAPSGLPQSEVDRIFLGISQYASDAIGLTATQVSPTDDPPLPVAEQSDTQTIVVADALDDEEAGP